MEVSQIRQISRMMILTTSLTFSTCNSYGDMPAVNQLPIYNRKIALRVAPVVPLASSRELPKPIDLSRFQYQLDLQEPILPSDNEFIGMNGDEEKNSFALAYDFAKKYDQAWPLWLDLTERKSQFAPLLYNHIAMQGKARLAFNLLGIYKLPLIDSRVVPMMTDDELETLRPQLSKFEFSNEEQMWAMSMFLSRTHSAQESLGMLEAMKSKPSVRMKLLKAVDLYKTGKLKEAMNELSEVPPQTSDRFDEYMLLRARLFFQSNDLSSAMASYQKVPMESPLWPEAILEMSWTQIKAEDYSKAAGQLFSLNEHVGKKVYQPERDLFKSMSYFGLCQFGDSLRSLIILEKSLDAAPKLEKGQFMESISGKLEKGQFTYALHILQNPTLRHLMEILRRTELEAQWLHKKLSSQPGSKILTALDSSLQKLRKDTHEKIESIAFANSQQAQAQLAKLRKEIELLKFEIYSAAGETLRMQASGATTESTGPKKNFNTSVTWDYSGELWDDEIGHLRSSLENACPKVAGAEKEIKN